MMLYAHNNANPSAPNTASPFAARSILARMLKAGSSAALK
jgi:hypothetical protein